MNKRKASCAFVSLPRHKRSNEVIRLKGLIRRQENKFGGRFTSHLDLDIRSSGSHHHWYDFCFLGSNRFTFWNAEIITTRRALLDEVNDIASSRALSMLTKDQIERESMIDCEPADISETGKVITHQLIPKEPTPYSQFAGRTLYEEIRFQEEKIISSEPPSIFESFSVDYGYVYGVGLKMVRDVEHIDRMVIEDAIDHFFAIGETDWISASPAQKIKNRIL